MAGNRNGNGRPAPLRETIFAVLDENDGQYVVETGRARKQLAVAVAERYDTKLDEASALNSIGTTISTLISDGVLEYPNNRMIRYASEYAGLPEEPEADAPEADAEPEPAPEPAKPQEPAAQIADQATARAVADNLLGSVIKIIQQRTTKNNQVEELTQEVADLKQALSEQQQRQPEDSGRVQELVAENSDLSGEVNRLEQLTLKLRRHIEDGKEQLERSRKAHGHANEEIGRLRGQLEQMRRNVREHPAFDDDQLAVLGKLMKEVPRG